MPWPTMTSRTLPLPLALLLLLSHCPGLAQPTRPHPELGVLHLNGRVYTSGEVIRYSALLASAHGQLHPSPSTYGYFDIIDPAGQRILFWRSALANARVSGQIQLPDTLGSGVYLFRFYTNWMRNLPGHLIPTTPFVVVGLADEHPDSLPLMRHTASRVPLARALEGRISPAQPVRVGEESTLRLTLPGRPGARYTVSVGISEANPLLSAADSGALRPLLMSPEPERPPFPITPAALHPRERGFSLLSGRLIGLPSGQPLAGQRVFLSHSDTVSNFRYSITSPDGIFCFLLDSTHNNRTLVVQLADPQVSADSVAWAFDSRHLPFDASAERAYTFTLNPDQAQHLEEVRRRGIVSAIYHPVQAVSPIRTASKPHNFYHTPSYSIDPDEFIELYDFADLTENLLLSVRFRKRGDRYTLAMVSPEEHLVHREGILLLLDGHPFFNLNFLSTLGSKEIRRVDVYHGPFMYGDLDFNGLVSVFTNDGLPLVASLFGTPAQLIHNPLHGVSFEPMATTNGLGLPAMSPNVHWEPQLNIAADEPTALRLPPLAFAGRYLVTITGFADDGQIITSSGTFYVEQP